MKILAKNEGGDIFQPYKASRQREREENIGNNSVDEKKEKEKEECKKIER